MTARLLTIALFLWPLAVHSQQRDIASTAIPTGTAEISGVVVSDESTPRPIRRAIVTLSGDIPSARSVITDDEGRFTFGRLPAGRFTVTARKPAYLATAYGARRPGRPGTSIALKNDERSRVSIVMARGAVLTGRVTTPAGLPVAGAQVGALDLGGADRLEALFDSTEFVTTDDRGGYRIYGLMPGEYVVAALPRALGSGEIGARSTTEMDALLAQIAQRNINVNPAPASPGSAPSSPFTPAPPVGFAPTYFPGTAVPQDATRISVTAGEERGGLDFQLGAVPVASVSGTVSGDVRNLSTVQLSLLIEGQRNIIRGATSPVLAQRPDADGRFKFANMPPGRYRITARARRGQNEAPPSRFAGLSAAGSGGGRMGAPPSGSEGDGDEFLYAIADVEIGGRNLDNVSLPLQPGGHFSGRLVFDSATPPASVDFSKCRLSLSPPSGTFYSQSSDGTIIGNMLSLVSPAALKPDGSFDIAGVGPGTFVLSATPPPGFPQTWWLRSAMVNGRDLLDSPIVFDVGTNLTGVVVTLSDRHTELTGVLKTSTGQPASEYAVIIFPADRALWLAGSRRMQATRPGNDGAFAVRNLPGGDYIIAAVTDADPREWQTTAFLDQVVASGVKITLRDGEKTRQDLQIAR